jgi:hypothetical protein
VMAFEPPNVAGTWYPTALAPTAGRDAPKKPNPKLQFANGDKTSEILRSPVRIGYEVV